MSGFLDLFEVLMIWSLLSNASNLGILAGNSTAHVSVFPSSCSRIECPSFDVIHSGHGFEIRRYNSPMWMSTAPIDDISFMEATKTGFMQLFNYIQGKNEYQQKIEMTAPVITEVKPSDGPFCASSFTVSFFVPKANQADTPPAKGLHVQKWGKIFAAVRQFSGFLTDADIGKEAASLHNSVAGTIWSDAIDKSHKGENTAIYAVAQYNSPFEFENRLNEIWLTFYMAENKI